MDMRIIKLAVLWTVIFFIGYYVQTKYPGWLKTLTMNTVNA